MSETPETDPPEAYTLALQQAAEVGWIVVRGGAVSWGADAGVAGGFTSADDLVYWLAQQLEVDLLNLARRQGSAQMAADGEPRTGIVNFAKRFVQR